MLLFLICLSIVYQNEGASSVSYAMHVSRKSRSQELPVESGYVYSQVDNKPAIMATFEGRGRRNALTYPPGLQDSTKSQIESLHHGTLDSIAPSNPSLDYAIAESNSKYSPGYDPSKLQSDMLYERLKSVMHYTPPTDYIPSDMNIGYGYPDRFYMDDNDVKTGSRSAYDSWPYYYSPYEYEKMKMEHDMDSFKNKRYADIDTSDMIIPVYEHIDEDVPFKQEIPFLPPSYNHDPTTPVPSVGTKQLFVPTVNEYHDKNDEDSLTFRGFGFDEHSSPSVDSARNKRLPSHYRNYDYYPIQTHDHVNPHGQSVAEKIYNKNHEFDNHEKGLDKKSNHKEAYEYAGKNQKDFKEHTDAFKNRYGAEDQKRKSHYAIKHNKDNGEKRKGFRRVYHKDEYQEDNEFYDNKNHNISGEDYGSSLANLGGSDAYLHSLANAAAGSEGIAINRLGNQDNSEYERGNVGHSRLKGFDNGSYRYSNGYHKK